MRTEVDYLGIKLKNPLMVSASPFSESIQQCKHLEDAGVSAIVMHSLFEEEINAELNEVDHMLFSGKQSFSEALDFFPQRSFENYESENYLINLRKLKSSLDIPVIASLNGVSRGGWLQFAKLIENEGADALELNVYYPVTKERKISNEIEALYIEDLKAIREAVKLPISVKISPDITALPNFVKQLSLTGAQSVTLFNRFYQPDIDLENLQWESKLYKSSPYDFGRTLRALATIYGQIPIELAASGGVQNGLDIVKAVMAGANAVMAATVFYDKGVAHAKVMLEEAIQWMEEKEYESFDQMRGSISLAKSPNPEALQRANYIRLLKKSYR